MLYTICDRTSFRMHFCYEITLKSFQWILVSVCVKQQQRVKQNQIHAHLRNAVMCHKRLAVAVATTLTKQWVEEITLLSCSLLYYRMKCTVIVYRTSFSECGSDWPFVWVDRHKCVLHVCVDWILFLSVSQCHTHTHLVIHFLQHGIVRIDFLYVRKKRECVCALFKL